MENFQVINPANSQVLEEYQYFSEERLSQLLSQSYESFQDWRRLELNQRLDLIRALGKCMDDKKRDFATAISKVMGKPVSQAVLEVEKCAKLANSIADVAKDWLAPEDITTPEARFRVSPQAQGTVLAIMPWNFPLWQVVRCALPTLAAGNTCILKHAEQVTGVALMLEKLFTETGFAPGVFQVAIASHSETAKLIQSKEVCGVAFTGSTRGGSQVAKLAGEAIKKSVLELGGTDPLIVMEDANLDTAVSWALRGRFSNCGQTCISSKRLIVPESVKEQFLTKLSQSIQKIVVGDPLLEKTDLGPMVNASILGEVENQVEEAKRLGATILTGGLRVESLAPGLYYAPTLITDIDSTMRVYREEVFGPVACVYSYQEEHEAIRLANDTDYGLGASIIGVDLEKANTLAAQLETGNVAFNSLVQSHAMVPFGGTKMSGYGRELGKAGMLEFTNQKVLADFS